MTKLTTLLLATATVLTAGPAPARAGLQLPNLRPLAPNSVHIGGADQDTSVSGRALRFSVTAWNDSDVPFDILGAPPRDLERTVANQCVAWASRVCLERREAGDLIFHPEHGHWHVTDYGLYELRYLDTQGAPDMSPAGLAAEGEKVSFCLMDTKREGAPRPGDPFNQTGFYRGCVGAIQGISPGWADVYGEYLFGQQIVVDGVPDGFYALVVTLDPEGKLFETTTDDNTSWQKIRIHGGGRFAGIAP